MNSNSKKMKPQNYNNIWTNANTVYFTFRFNYLTVIKCVEYCARNKTGVKINSTYN